MIRPPPSPLFAPRMSQRVAPCNGMLQHMRRFAAVPCLSLLALRTLAMCAAGLSRRPPGID